jgi:hypothetical protein
MTNDFLSEKDLAAQLKITVHALRRWRMENRGPRFHKIGSLVRYRSTDVSDWLQLQPTGGSQTLPQGSQN